MRFRVSFEAGESDLWPYRSESNRQSRFILGSNALIVGCFFMSGLLGDFSSLDRVVGIRVDDVTVDDLLLVHRSFWKIIGIWRKAIINQSSYQPINRSIDQSITQSINQSIISYNIFKQNLQRFIQLSENCDQKLQTEFVVLDLFSSFILLLVHSAESKLRLSTPTWIWGLLIYVFLVIHVLLYRHYTTNLQFN